ncbi:MAG: penicillin acylase family protein [Bacteroidota bacterium]
MKNLLLYTLVLVVCLSCKTQQQPSEDTLSIPGLIEKVEVIRDSLGINHIYAENQHDLFLAQGYCAAKDRLFQFEVWRRQATGTVAEMLGERALNRDIGTRLFKFRGDMTTEMNYYHEDGVEIITAYTNGINAYIEEVQNNPDLLPITLKAIGIMPEKWTPEVVISRHQGLLGNIRLELTVGRAVAAIGPEKTKKYFWFHPKEPILDLDSAINGELLSDNILGLYLAYRQPVRFEPQDVLPEYRIQETGMYTPSKEETLESSILDQLWIGSNNWVTRPALSANGHAYMANDPHRTLAVPSLRYWVHLSAPGWNVIGGGEPEIPGVSIGHNDHGAWGLTVFRTDGEDMYVYDINPDNPHQYKFNDEWQDMKVITETIPVKGSDAVTVDLRYTHHGPITHIDSVNHTAYAVKCAWMEPGGSPYLASLRMNQAKNWAEFKAACNYSHIPGENMIWADKNGNIGWQAVGIAPIRKGFSGMVPIPGDGRYEWSGYLPIVKKPSVYNPEEGFFATANQNVIPNDYELWDAIGYSWSDPFRGDRVEEVLGSGKPFTMEDMKALQIDYLSIPARQLVPLLLSLEVKDEMSQKAFAQLAEWDFRLLKNSSNAAIYVEWEKALINDYFKHFPDPEAEKVIPSIQLGKLITWLLKPELHFGKNGESLRDDYLLATFSSAIDVLETRFGNDIPAWQYGHETMKHVKIIHPLGNVVNADLQARLNTPLAPRGGNQFTPGATGRSYKQSHGATFKIIVDVNDWDKSIGMNAPGQSGDPESPFYMNLFDNWAADDYFPVLFSRTAVEGAKSEHYQLLPEKSEGK